MIDPFKKINEEEKQNLLKKLERRIIYLELSLVSLEMHRLLYREDVI